MSLISMNQIMYESYG